MARHILCATAHSNQVVYDFFFQGSLRINPRKFQEAFVPSPVSTVYSSKLCFYDSSSKLYCSFPAGITMVLRFMLVCSLSAE